MGALFLTACNEANMEASKDVVTHFKESIREIETVDMNVLMEMSGLDSGDVIDFSLKADARVDRTEGETPKMEMGLKAKGNLKTEGKNLDGDASLKILTIGDQFYFNLGDFNVSDADAAKLKALLSPYQNKWQRLASDFVPENIRELQVKTEETKQKEEALKTLFINTKLFDVTKEYGIEKIGGVNTYHYQIKLNKEGLKTYFKGAAEINGQPMTNEEVDQATDFADTVSNIEIWIGQDDYYLYKGVADFSAKDADQNLESNVKLTYMANSYNKDLTITAPENAAEFNPLALIMGMQLGGGLPTGELPLE